MAAEIKPGLAPKMYDAYFWIALQLAQQNSTRVLHNLLRAMPRLAQNHPFLLDYIPWRLPEYSSVAAVVWAHNAPILALLCGKDLSLVEVLGTNRAKTICRRNSRIDAKKGLAQLVMRWDIENRALFVKLNQSGWTREHCYATKCLETNRFRLDASISGIDMARKLGIEYSFEDTTSNTYHAKLDRDGSIWLWRKWSE